MKHIRLYDLRRGVYSQELPPTVVLALGNFDGVHSAHRALLARTAQLANKFSITSAVWCFDPPSSAYLGTASSQLSTTEERLALFAECGLDYAYLADFTALRDLSPTAFVHDILVKNCHAVHAVCGFNYRFGKGGCGTEHDLRQALGEQAVDVIPPQYAEINGKPMVISSTAVRAALVAGEASTAALLLGRPYSLTAPVVHGKRLGRTLGLPTINQNVPDGKLFPAGGIYVTRVWIDGKAYIGVTNVGHRPTVDYPDAPVNCETHILEFDRDLYDKSVKIEFLCRLRDERKFDSLDELKTAVQGDIAAAKRYFDQ